MTSRGIVRTARTLTTCLIAVLLCPAFGQIAAFADPGSLSCSAAHACCRAHGTAACPHEMTSAAHDGRCHREICVLKCGDRSADATIPIMLIGFLQAPATVNPDLVPAALAISSGNIARSFIALPHTPPPRALL